MDFIEVTFHYIECIHFYSKNSESQLGQQASEVTQDGDIIDIANIVEIAAINMMRDERTELATDDLLQDGMYAYRLAWMFAIYVDVHRYAQAEATLTYGRNL
ncbi:hypothetical protein DY000_02057639 [Brassica cretica]|uniref:Uncharacterized protein n=1 Tax=Brassica cretica TaxID=69181 RepID=A0ABQ7ALE8_BRACR|nr:hypothetical protein DY000_02057639 [Brassica cretica]